MDHSDSDEDYGRSHPPATTPEGREHQMVELAVNLAERQMRDGTASAQVITHYLKMGSERERLEREKLVGENELLHARIKNLEEGSDLGRLAEAALEAFRGYGAPP